MRIAKSEFTCIREGLVIRGTMFRPEGNHLPIAIVSHGFMANRKSVVKYARQLAMWGYAAFCFDFNGGCVYGKSDGKTTDMSVLTEREDLKAVIAYTKALKFTDSDRILLMGCSQGGFVSALTAAQMSEQISKLILFYPALCIPDDARKGKMMMAEFDPDNIPEIIKCGPMTLGRCYPATVKDMDPFEEISAYKGPVLIVHGDEDKIVDVSYAVRAKEAYMARVSMDKLSESGCRLRILEGAGHGFDRQADKTALDEIWRFLTCTEPVEERVKPDRNRFSLMTFPLIQDFVRKTMTIQDSFRLAEEAGIPAVDVMNVKMKKVPEYLEAMRSTGVKVKCYISTVSFLNRREAIEKALDREMAVAHALGAQLFMIVPYYPILDVNKARKVGRGRMRKRLVGAFRLAVEKGKIYGLQVCFETTPQEEICLSGTEDCRYVLERVRGLSLVFDTANMLPHGIRPWSITKP